MTDIRCKYTNINSYYYLVLCCCMPCIDCFCCDLIVFHWEPELIFLAAGLHLDQNPFHKPNLETIQGSTLFASEPNFF